LNKFAVVEKERGFAHPVLWICNGLSTVALQAVAIQVDSEGSISRLLQAGLQCAETVSALFGDFLMFFSAPFFAMSIRFFFERAVAVRLVGFTRRIRPIGLRPFFSR